MNTPNAQSFEAWADNAAQTDTQKVLATMEPVLKCVADLHSQARAHGNIRPNTLQVSSDNSINLRSFEDAASPLMDRASEYAPPEAYDDPQPSATILGDIYAISAVLYRALSAQTPVSASVRKKTASHILPMDNVSKRIGEALSKGLALQPGDRPANLSELRELLQDVNQLATPALAEQINKALKEKSKLDGGQTGSGSRGTPPPKPAVQNSAFIRADSPEAQRYQPLVHTPARDAHSPERANQGLPAMAPAERVTAQPTPAAPPAPAVKAAAERAAAERAAAERATAERATAERATAERATAERATAERATAERATAERAAAERAAAERAAAERAAAERAAAERAAAERAAAERAAAERAAATIPTVAKRLPINLTVGKQFEIPLAKFIPDSGGWQIRFQDADALGLSYDAEKKVLFGTPKMPGEHALKIQLTHPEIKNRPPWDKSIAVTINPDPDSLWLNRDSNKNDPYWKPDTDHKDTSTPHARIIAASQRGRSHAHEGIFRDDDFSLRFDEASDWHLLAAADGAGGSKYSRRGSKIACEQVLEFMSQWLVKERTTLDAAVEAFVGEKSDGKFRTAAYQWLAGAAFQALTAIQAEVKKNPPATQRDYHTTILLAVTKWTRAGWVIATFSIGDGGIALRRVNGEPKSLCTPDSGEFGGQTVFLTVPNVLSKAEEVMKRIHIVIEPNLSALALMTDGVTDPKFPTEVSLEDVNVWSAFWSELTAKVDFRLANKDSSAQLLQWLSFKSPGNHDDRTIVVLLPRGTVE